MAIASSWHGSWQQQQRKHHQRNGIIMATSEHIMAWHHQR